MRAGLRTARLLAVLFLLAVIAGCAASPVYNRSRESQPHVSRPHGDQKSHSAPTGQDQRAKGEVFEGIASYYSDQFAGRPTASGDIFDPHAYTCAHKSLPFGTVLRVTLLETGKEVIVMVNDRGPFIPGRILDLSEEAARIIGLTEKGTGMVRIEILRKGKG